MKNGNCVAQFLLVGSAQNTAESREALETRNIGAVCLFANALSTTLYFTLQSLLVFSNPRPHSERSMLEPIERGVLRRWSRCPLLVAAYTYLFSCVFSSGAFIVRFAVSTEPSILHITFRAWVSILFAAFVASSTCYAVLTWANKILKPGITLGTIPLQPVSSSLISALMLDVPITKEKLVAGAIVILGVVALLAARNMEDKKQEARLGGDPSRNPEAVSSPLLTEPENDDN